MYRIELTDAEFETLGWAAARGYFPQITYRQMYLENDDEPSGHRMTLRPWRIPERASWEITMLRDKDPDAYLLCIGQPLLGKLLKLESEII